MNYPGDYDLTGVREGFDPATAERSGNFWSYVDVRDVVSNVEAALAADHDGHEAYLAVAAENYLGRPPAETIEAVSTTCPRTATSTARRPRSRRRRPARNSTGSPPTPGARPRARTCRTPLSSEFGL